MESSGRELVMSSVYAIAFPSGKLYIGVTSKTVAERLSKHLWDVRNGSKLAAHNALRKYGRNVKLVILAQGVSFDEAKDLEIWWISRLNTMRPGGYNLTAGGDGLCNPAPEVRQKLSQAQIGNQKAKDFKYSAEVRKRRSEAVKLSWKNPEHRQRKMDALGSEECKRKISDATKGKPKSEETKRRMSESSKLRTRGLDGRYNANS